MLAHAGHPPRFESPFDGAPFALLVVAAHEIAGNTRARLADDAIAAGCRYASTWGAGCGDWHEDFDWAYLATCDGHEPTDETLVMTTAHDRELLGDAIWFHLFCTNFQEVVLRRYLIWMLDDRPELTRDVRRTVSRLLAS